LSYCHFPECQIVLMRTAGMLNCNTSSSSMSPPPSPTILKRQKVILPKTLAPHFVLGVSLVEGRRPTQLRQLFPLFGRRSGQVPSSGFTFSLSSNASACFRGEPHTFREDNMRSLQKMGHLTNEIATPILGPGSIGTVPYRAARACQTLRPSCVLRSVYVCLLI
jgi:hypothetical protein